MAPPPPPQLVAKWTPFFPRLRFDFNPFHFLTNSSFYALPQKDGVLFPFCRINTCLPIVLPALMAMFLRPPLTLFPQFLPALVLHTLPPLRLLVDPNHAIVRAAVFNTIPRIPTFLVVMSQTFCTAPVATPLYCVTYFRCHSLHLSFLFAVTSSIAVIPTLLVTQCDATSFRTFPGFFIHLFVSKFSSLSPPPFGRLLPNSSPFFSWTPPPSIEVPPFGGDFT